LTKSKKFINFKLCKKLPSHKELRYPKLEIRRKFGEFGKKPGEFGKERKPIP
jgi:hypothetical protein